MKSLKLVATTIFATTLAFSVNVPSLSAQVVSLTEENSVRLSGNDRYQTSLAISKEGWLDGEAPVVVIATGADFPDALAATPLASSYSAPILLSRKNSLPAGFADELMRLGTEHVILVGGTLALSDALKNQIEDLNITIERISGETREETAVKIAREIAKEKGVEETLYVTTSSNFADSLSISSIAGYHEHPILLVPTTGVPKVVADFISEFPVENALIIGGEKVVSPSIEKLFENPIRIAGAGRYETNKAFNDFALDAGLTLTPEYLFIATGENYPDALSGSALASLFASPIVLTAINPLASSKAQIQDYSYENSYFAILGGELPLPTDTLEKLFHQ